MNFLGKFTFNSEASNKNIKRTLYVQSFRLTFQRDDLLKDIHDKLIMFDAELRLLRHEKTHTDVKLKNADLRYNELFQQILNKSLTLSGTLT